MSSSKTTSNGSGNNEPESSTTTSDSSSSQQTQQLSQGSSASSSSSTTTSSASREQTSYDKILKESIKQLRQHEHWVKTVLISQLVEANSTVCELWCGGCVDLGKWGRAHIGSYLGLDIAEDKLKLARERVDQKINSDPKFNKFSVKFRNKDPLTDPGLEESIYDVVACFNNFGKCFSSKETARNFLRQASVRLKPGGFFFGILPDSSSLWYKAQKSGGSFIKGDLFTVNFMEENFDHFGCRYRVSFISYPNTFVEDLDEYLVHFPSLIQLAKEENLKMLEITNFQEFYEDNKKNYHEQLKALNVGDRNGKILVQALEAMGLFTTFIFEKMEVQQ